MTTHSSAFNAQSPYIPSLDGWRAVAILIVFTSHIGLGHIVPGGLGVTIFFFLSGYLITTLLIQEHERNGQINILHFYLRRALRLMPPLIVTLSIIYIFTYFGITQGGISMAGFFSQLLYFANYYYLFFDAGNSTPAGTGIFWSLAVEEHFYFVFPFIFITLYSKKKGESLRNLLILVCATTLVWRYILILVLDSSASRTYYATDTRIDSIVFGCLLALIKNPMQPIETPKKLLWKDWFILGSAIATLLATLAIRDANFRETLRYSMQGMALAPLFYYSIRQHTHWVFRTLNTAPLRKIGQYSYSIYLIHYFFIENLHTIQTHSIVKISAAIALTLLYARLIEKLVDKPLVKLRREFR